MRRVIALVLDGLRRDMVTEDLTPNLLHHAAMAERFEAHRSVFPSATRVVSSSFSTGCYPAKHELQGNSLVLIENGEFVVHDAGHPDFLQHKRRITGRSLAMPTIAERIRGIGDAMIFSNVSPGAAYAHDPDGHGYVYHRAGSFGPGRKPVQGWNASDIALDTCGDRALAERFIDMAIHNRRVPFALLWCAEPDATSHARPLGSPEHLDIIRKADHTARIVMDAVAAARTAGDDILFVIASDHGHQTVSGVIDINAELIAAGLKEGPDSGDVLSVSNGTSALVYVHERHADRVAPIGAFLSGQSWSGNVIGPNDLASIGQAPRHGLAFAVGMASNEDPNEFGIPGQSFAAKPAGGKPDRFGCGQHGGFARFEQSPFLMIDGPGFKPAATRADKTSAVDVAPTILTHLGVAFQGIDGRALQA